jgi:hypothetical protein
MADLRALGAGLEAYAEEHGGYPVASDLNDLLSRMSDAPAALPSRDGWGRPFRAVSDGSSYVLSSSGKDGVFSDCSGGATQNFDADICFADGEFTQWPEGAQQ